MVIPVDIVFYILRLYYEKDIDKILKALNIKLKVDNEQRSFEFENFVE